MPVIDLGRNRIQLTFSDKEANGPRYLFDQIRIMKVDIGINNPTKAGKPYTINLSLEAAYFLKKIFKDAGWGWSPSDKYLAAAKSLYDSENFFKRIVDISERIKTIDPDMLKIDGYEFKNKPWGHQKIGFSLLRELRSILLTADMRTGKTFIVSTHVEDMIRQGKITKALVLCPAGIMESTWIRDVTRHTGLHGLALSHPTSKGRIALSERPIITIPHEDGSFAIERGTPSFYVLNHDAVRSEDLLKHILFSVKPDCFICDESHHFKNPSAQRTKAAMKIAEFVHGIGGSVICMTGTPVTKDIRDLYSQMRMVDPTVFNYSFNEFKSRYCIIQSFGNPEDPGSRFFEIMKGMKNFDDLKARYEPRSYRIEIEQCHDMPQKIFTTQNIDMTPDQRMHHDALLNDLVTVLDGNVISTTTLSKFIKLVQVTGGYLYDEEKKVNILKGNPKLEALEDILTQILSKEGRKAVVWTNYRPSTLIIRRMLQDNNIKFCELTSQSDMDRNQAEFQFQNDSSYQVMLATPSLAEGKNMSVASYCIYYDNNFKFVDREQSERRVYTPESLRHGKIVYIDLIANDSIDQLIYESIQKKAEVNKVVTKERLIALMQIGKKK